MRGKKRSVLLRPPALVVMVALLLAVSGVLYAHWTATLNLDGNINTGGVGVGWFGAWTNDDGFDNGDGEDGGPFDGKFDGWGGDSSADPGYDKDVAACFAQADGSQLNVSIENAYPSYNCELTATVGGQGSIPVRATTLNMTAWKNYCSLFDDDMNEYMGDALNYDEGGPYHDENGDGMFDEVDGDYRLHDDCVNDVVMEVRPGASEGNFEFGMPGGPAEIEGDISAGIRCGTQVDPIPCRFYFDEGVWQEPWDGPTVGDGEGNEFADEDEDGTYDGDEAQVFNHCDESGLFTTSGWIHVLQPADQNANYMWNLSQEYVNWNEWDVTMCTPGSWVDPDGVPDNGDEVRYIP